VIKLQTNPPVSIVIPCYNADRWVSGAIESALGQTYSNVEVVVVDDGSTDGSLEVIKQFDGKIKWLSTPNRGPCAARNVGLRAARGEWIQFLDADDLLHPDKLDLSLKSCESYPSVEFVWAPHVSIGEDFSLNSPEARAPEPLDMQIKLSQDALLAYYAPSVAMFRSRFLERVGDWNESLKRWVDLEYHARIAALLPCYARLSKPLYFYRQHSGERISNSNRNHSNIHAAVESLAITRNILEGSRISPLVWKPSVWPFYLQLARSSAVSGDQKTFLDLMQEAARLRGSPRFHLKCYIAKLSVQLFGLKLTSALIECTLRSSISGKKD
jgi:glycosyltransferase involved in cell wall biosynthesis